MNFNKYKPKSYLTKTLDSFQDDENLLIENLFNFIITSNYFKIGYCETLFKDINDCIVYYSINKKTNLFLDYAYQDLINKKIIKSPRLAAIYSLVVADHKLPSKIHDKVAEFVVNSKILVEDIIRSCKNFDEKSLNFTIKYSFEDLESNAPEIYLYKYNLSKPTK